MMDADTQARVRGVIEQFLQKVAPKFDEWSLPQVRNAYPFHRIVFPAEAVVAARVERSIVTTMGTTLYPQLAEAVVQSAHNIVKREASIEGMLNDAACNMIEQIVSELRAKSPRGVPRRQPDQPQEISDILNSRGGGTRDISVTADLYVEDFREGPLFVELKSPQPNLDVAAESKRKMLYYLALMDRKGFANPKAFLGLYYNPYITRKLYSTNHSVTQRIMDMEYEVLLGAELWDYLGGPGTYDAILSIIDSIGPRSD